MSLFIPPPAEFYEGKSSDYLAGWVKAMKEHWAGFGIKVEFPLKSNRSYTSFNYSGSGFAARIKREHFEAVLKLTQPYFGKCNVIDLGCADGVFLPSVSNYFNNVAAIDIEPKFVQQATELSEFAKLKNVKSSCSEGKSILQLQEELSGIEWDILFLLEVMEHVGDPKRMYDSKLEFLEGAATLLKKGGLLVISVPKMVGLAFLIQRFGISMLGLPKEPISFGNLFRASFLRDAEAMEKYWWNGGHMGFSHLKLEKYMRKSFEIVKKKNLLFQAVYVIRKN